VAQPERKLVLLGILVRSAADVVGCRRIGIGVVLSPGQRSGVLSLGAVGQAQPQPGKGRPADRVIHAAIELPELGGAVLPEAVGLEL
jgi:hypothetical protein